MLYEKILAGSDRSASTPFTVYLLFLSWILLAAGFGTIIMTSGTVTFTTTKVCNGIDVCRTIPDTPIYDANAQPPQSVWVPCEALKSQLAIMLPCNIVAFVLCFLLFGFSMFLAAEEEFSKTQAVAYTVGALIALVCTAMEAVLAIHVFLTPLCTYPGQEKKGVQNIRDAISAAGNRMELGPQFAIILAAFFFQLVALMWVHRRILRKVCGCFRWCGDYRNQMRRAREADRIRQASAAVAAEGPEGFNYRANDASLHRDI